MILFENVYVFDVNTPCCHDCITAVVTLSRGKHEEQILNIYVLKSQSFMILEC